MNDPASQPSILVVDDDEIVLGFFKAALQTQQFQVYSAADGVEAEEVFRAHVEEIDLVLLDVVIPRQSAEVTLRHMRELRPGVRVLLTSGHLVQFDEEQLAQQRGVRFLTKPCRPAVLLRTIREMLAEPEAAPAPPDAPR